MLQGLGWRGADLSTFCPRGGHGTHGLTTGTATVALAAPRGHADLFPAPGMTGSGKYQDWKASTEPLILPC